MVAGLLLHSPTAVRLRWQQRAEGTLFYLILRHGLIEFEGVLRCH